MKKARLTPKQVAERWGCSTRLILDHIASGTIPAVNIGRAGSKKPRYRISESDLEKFEASRTVRVVSTPTRRKKKNSTIIEFFLVLFILTDGNAMNELDQQIIEATDIEAVVRTYYPADKLDKVNGEWFKVHALDREDSSASAGIHLESGVYNDFSKTGAESLYAWLIATGHFVQWFDVRNELASRAGIKISKSKKQKELDRKEHFEELMSYASFTLTENTIYTRGLCKHKKGITPEALEAFGGKPAKYNNIKYENVDSTQQKINIVVAIPVFNVRAPRPDMVPPSGVIMYPNNGRAVYTSSGEAKGILIRGTAGLIGKHGLEILMHQEKRKEIESIIKTEGPSCAMTLWAEMSPEDRDHFPIVTNSSGAAESTNDEYWGRLLDNLPLCTIHDSDKPGQDGLKHWREYVAPYCSKYVNIVLHDEIKEKKGLDLRDWLNAGGTWLELKAMILSAKPIMVSERENVKHMTVNEQTLHSIGCTVIGDLGGKFNLVQIYSNIRREYFDISPAHLNEFQVTQMFGEVTGDLVSRNSIPIERIKTAISARTAECGRVNPHDRIGPGIWCSRDKARFAIVGEQGLFVYDETGGLDIQDDHRFDGRAALLRTDNFTDPWFEYEKLAKYIRKAYDDREWSVNVMWELNNIFQVWDNLLHGSDDAFLLSGLTVATILQDIWEIRPQVWVSGPTDSGKSHMTRVFEWMFDTLMARMDAPTEAGFRNFIQNQKRFVTIDEFEKSAHRKKIIETMRTTTKGGNVPRATADHRSISFSIKHLPWFTGTNRGYEKYAADSNRVIKIDLKAPTPEQYARGQKFPSQESLRDLGHKIIAVAIVHWKKMLEMEAALSRLSIPGVAHRLIECYAVPTAVHAAVMNHDAKSAEKMLADMLRTRAEDVEQSAEADDEKMLHFILNHSIRVGNVDWPLGVLAQYREPVDGLAAGESAQDKTGENGVRIVNGGDWFFDETTIQDLPWWKQSDYSKTGIAESLKRIIAASGEVDIAKYKIKQTVRMKRGRTDIRASRVPAAVMKKFVSEQQLELGFDEVESITVQE